MPRIPQSNFNNQFSSRVGRESSSAPKATGIDNALKAAQNVTGVMAKLQDQKERTEAYATATDVTREYQRKKVLYESALSTVDGKGNYSYVDPTKDQEDPANIDPKTKQPKREKGSIFELYKDLKSTYDAGKESTKEITRGDIASELMDQNVGDDLVRLSTKQNKAITRKQQSETYNGVINTINMGIEKFMDTDNFFGTGKDVKLKVDSQVNNMTRELDAMSPVLGVENTEKLGKYVDAKLHGMSKNILSMDANQKNFDIADALASKIRDPLKQSIAMREVESGKKKAATFASAKTMRNNITMSSKIQSEVYMDEAMELEAMQMAKNTKGAFIDPKYSTLTREQMDESSADLVATILAKKKLQTSLETKDISKELGGGPAPLLRTPSQEIVDEIDAEITASGLSDLFTSSPEFQEAIKLKTVAKMKAMYGDMKNTVAESVMAQNPSKRGEDLHVATVDAANKQGFGDVALMPEKQAKKGRADIKLNMAKDSDLAWQQAAGMWQEAGERFGRALTIDLVGKDSSLSFMIPASDLPMDQTDEVFKEASMANENKDRYGVTPKKLQEAWISKRPQFLDTIADTSWGRGVEQMIKNKALALSEDGVVGGMQAAVEWYGSNVTALTSDSGRNVMVAVPQTGSVNYTDPKIKASLSLGMNEASKLPNLPRRTKEFILSQYVGLTPKKLKHQTPEDLEFMLGKAISMQPSTRWKNKVEMKYDGVTVTDSTGEEILYDVDDIIKIGQHASKKQHAVRMKEGNKTGRQR